MLKKASPPMEKFSIEIPENKEEEMECQEPSPENIPVMPEIRVSKRENKGIPAEWYRCMVKAAFIKKPESWDEMLELPVRKRSQWIVTAEEEMRSLKNYEHTKLNYLLE